MSVCRCECVRDGVYMCAILFHGTQKSLLLVRFAYVHIFRSLARNIQDKHKVQFSYIVEVFHSQERELCSGISGKIINY